MTIIGFLSLSKFQTSKTQHTSPPPPQKKPQNIRYARVTQSRGYLESKPKKPTKTQTLLLMTEGGSLSNQFVMCFRLTIALTKLKLLQTFGSLETHPDYLEVCIFKDSFCIKHNCINACYLLEEHESHTNKKWPVD